MRNILLFIRRFFNLVLFLVLQGVAIAFMVNYNKTHQAAFAEAATEVTGRLGSKYSDITGYFNLKQENERLRAEHNRLYNLLPASFSSPDTSRIIFIDSLYKDTLGKLRKFVFLDAAVANNSVNEENNYMTVFRGGKQGVKKDMAVISPSGIVGRVILVSDNYARVMSILNHNSKVSAVLKNTSYTGIVEWDGKDPQYVLFKGVPKSAKLKQGDSVLTSNLSGSYPPGIMVGTIQGFAAESSSSNFYSIKVKTATNFFTIQNVYLVENLLLSEQQRLEAQSPAN